MSNATTIIETDNSALKQYEFPELSEMLPACVEEVVGKLIHHPEIKRFGKTCHQKRDIGKKQLAPSIPLTSNLQSLLQFVNKEFRAEFNGILVNYYENGNETIGAHSDDERNLDSVGLVSISYRATRKFRIRHKFSKKIAVDIGLESGMVLHMAGKFQQEFTHEIPKETRVSDTFKSKGVQDSGILLRKK